MREKCLIISKLCVGLTFYITLCCVVTCLFLCESSKKKETSWLVTCLFLRESSKKKETSW